MGDYYDFLKRILAYCEEHHIKPARFELDAGLSKGQISHWKKGYFLPSRRSQDKIASAMGISVDDLMLRTYEQFYGAHSDPVAADYAASSHTHPYSKYIPVFQDPPCGIEERCTAMYEIPLAEDELGSSDDCYAFIMRDSSMIPEFYPGDIVIVKRDPAPETGDTAVIIVPGEQSIVRRLTRTADGIILDAYNKHYDPIWYSNEEMHLLPVFFGGKVVRIQRTIRSSAHSIPEDSIL